MDKDKIMEAMEYIDPGLIEAAGREVSAAKRGRRGWSRPAVIAACLCAVLAGTAVAAELSGVRIVDLWENETRVVDPDGTQEEVSGVTISRGIRYFSVDELSQQVMELDRGFTKSAARSFSSWEEMEDFVGIRVMENPVLAAVHSGGTVDVGLPGGEGRFVARFARTILTCGRGKGSASMFPQSWRWIRKTGLLMRWKCSIHRMRRPLPGRRM